MRSLSMEKKRRRSRDRSRSTDWRDSKGASQKHHGAYRNATKDSHKDPGFQTHMSKLGQKTPMSVVPQHSNQRPALCRNAHNCKFLFDGCHVYHPKSDTSAYHKAYGYTNEGEKPMNRSAPWGKNRYVAKSSKTQQRAAGEGKGG